MCSRGRDVDRLGMPGVKGGCREVGVETVIPGLCAVGSKASIPHLLKTLISS